MEGSAMNMPLKIRVNGTLRESEVEPRVLLVEFLRESCGLTGTHVGCETGVCGACTVLVDGKAVKSCTMFAAQADGSEVTTVEDASRPGRLLGVPWPPVRLLHAGHDNDCGPAS
jgi:carbon-monoxide dehydrogenase small subunit